MHKLLKLKSRKGFKEQITPFLHMHGQIKVKEAMILMGMGYYQTYSFLEKCVKKGCLQKRKISTKTGAVNIYEKPK